MHWAAKYIGKPWISGGQGPDKFDCWGLVRFVMLDQRGIVLPVVNVDAASMIKVVRCFRDGSYDGWKQVDDPVEFDGVLMSHASHPHHVGVWIGVDGGKVLHAVKGAGVTAMDRLHLRAAGWNIIGFWRYNECKQA